jgi:hypothetical protein
VNSVKNRYIVKNVVEHMQIFFWINISQEAIVLMDGPDYTDRLTVDYDVEWDVDGRIYSAK